MTDAVLQEAPQASSALKETKAAKFVRYFAEKKAAEAKASAEAPEEKPAEAPESAPAPVEPPKEVPPEKPAEPEQKKEEPAPNLQVQFSALQRAEKRLRDEQKAFEDQRKAFEAETKEVQTIKQLLGADKYALIDHLGLDVEEWARRTLGKPKPQAPTPQPQQNVVTKEEFDRLVATLQYQEAKSVKITEIAKALQESPEQYAYTIARGGPEVVWRALEMSFNETGELPTTKEIMSNVEQFFEKEAESYWQVPKTQKRFAVKSTAVQETTKPEKSEASSEKPTKAASASVPDRVPAKLTKEERRKRMAAVFAGNA